MTVRFSFGYVAISWLTCLILSVASIAIRTEVRIHIVGKFIRKEFHAMNEKLSTSANITVMQWFHSLKTNDILLNGVSAKKWRKSWIMNCMCPRHWESRSILHMFYFHNYLSPDAEKFADEDREGFYFNWRHLRLSRRRQRRMHRTLGGLSARCCQSACGVDQLRSAC